MKLLSIALVLTALFTVNARQLVKLTGKKDVLTVQKLTANADGSISYIYDGKHWTAPEYSYDYARIPKPGAILAADKALQSKNYVKAEKLFEIEYRKYKNLGWGVYCLTNRAIALEKIGRSKEAIKLLEVLKSWESTDPALEKDFRVANRFYTDLLIKKKEYKKAAIQAESLLNSNDDDDVFFAFDRKGNIALLQKDEKRAVQNYLQACFIVTEHPRKAEVLYKTIVLLKKMKDKRWKNLASFLKKQYPNSEYAKKL